MALGRRCRWGHRNSSSTDYSNVTDAIHKSTDVDKMSLWEIGTIIFAVSSIGGVMLLLCFFICFLRRRNGSSWNDSVSEASNPEVVKPPPTYEEVVGSNNFPVRQDGAASNGYTMNVATIGNLQMQVQQPPSYDSLSAVTTGLSAQPTTPENTSSNPPNPADNQTETRAEPSVAETPQPTSGAPDSPDGICAVTMPPSCSDQVPLAEQEQGSALPV
ncbi:uncharacterized protein LOC135496245 isoform X2 [Lineus longissimus]|uniref:uncharacterized protein LOC135496245 isoform X2 n=1 Tax=Lineus longissimus TaxID=88925 RepID=UPI00315C9CF2